MSLEQVSVGDNHVQAHNDERDAIGFLETAVENGFEKTLSRMASRRLTVRRRSEAFPPVHPSPPTITHSTTQPLTGTITTLPFNTQQITLLGCVPADNIANNYRSNGVNAFGTANAWGWETDHYGNDLVVSWRANVAAIPQMWIFIDDQPTTPAPFAPDPGVPLVAGTTYFTRLPFSSLGDHRIRVYWRYMSLRGLHFPGGHFLSPTPKPSWSMIVLGDSFVQGTGNTLTDLETFPIPLSRLLDCEMYIAGQGGTGYGNPGSGPSAPYTDAARLAGVAASGADVCLIWGSVNDDGVGTASETGAKASEVYAALAELSPKMKLVVVGPQMSGASNSTAVLRAEKLAAVKAAAMAAPNVIGFIDTIGTVNPMPAWANNTAYTTGQRVSYQGGVYECIIAHTSAGGVLDLSKWKMVSWFNGTSHSGSPNGSGNRDVFLQSDNVHPNVAGSRNIAFRLANEIANIFNAA
jgi:uncharacterized protein YciI